MIRSTLKVAAVATLAISAMSAHAALTLTGLSCSNSILNPAYTACSGAFDGNNLGNAARLADVQAAVNSLSGSTALTFAGSSTDASNGPFTSSPTGNAGTLTFDSAIDGAFVLALKAGDAFSLFYYDGSGAPISSIDFTTLGVSVNVRGIGNGLSHATLYEGAPVPSIPEPETYALMLAGLGAMGFVARRRKA